MMVPYVNTFGYFADSWASGDDERFVSDDVFVVIEVAEEFFGIVIYVVGLFKKAWAEKIVENLP